MPAAALALVASHAASNYELSDQSGNTLFRQFGEAVLSDVPDRRDAILLTHGDETLNAVRYAHRLRGHRPNLLILDQNYAQFVWFVSRARNSLAFANVTFPGSHYGSAEGGFVMAEFLAANYPRHSIYVCGGFVPADSSWQAEYRLWPLGLVSQVLRRGATIKLGKWAAKTAPMLPRLTFHSKPQEGSWEEIIAKNHYLAAYHARPYAVLQYAYEPTGQQGGGGAPDSAAERERFRLAAQLYEQTAAVPLNGSVVLPDYVYRNLGVAYSQARGRREAASPRDWCVTAAWLPR